MRIQTTTAGLAVIVLFEQSQQFCIRHQGQVFFVKSEREAARAVQIIRETLPHYTARAQRVRYGQG